MYLRVTGHHLSKKYTGELIWDIFKIIILFTQRINALYTLNAVSLVIGWAVFSAAGTDHYLNTDPLIKFVRVLTATASIAKAVYTNQGF